MAVGPPVLGLPIRTRHGPNRTGRGGRTAAFKFYELRDNLAHAVCEPKWLRYRLLHVAGRLTRHARRLTLHLPADWPWAAAIAKAFKRLAALPA